MRLLLDENLPNRGASQLCAGLGYKVAPLEIGEVLGGVFANREIGSLQDVVGDYAQRG